MSPNATDSSAMLREERKIPNGCANGWSAVSDSAKKQCWKSQACLKINDAVALVKHYVLRAYIVLWRKRHKPLPLPTLFDERVYFDDEILQIAFVSQKKKQYSSDIFSLLAKQTFRNISPI